jgi:hypothetical protein
VEIQPRYELRLSSAGMYPDVEYFKCSLSKMYEEPRRDGKIRLYSVPTSSIRFLRGSSARDGMDMEVPKILPVPTMGRTGEHGMVSAHHVENFLALCFPTQLLNCSTSLVIVALPITVHP